MIHHVIRLDRPGESLQWQSLKPEDLSAAESAVILSMTAPPQMRTLQDNNVIALRVEVTAHVLVAVPLVGPAPSPAREAA